MSKKVAVIILNWNGLSLLEQYLPTVLAYTPRSLADVILADNGSGDDSVSYAKSLGVHTLELGRNYGFAEGYNRAIRLAEGYEYVLLLNSDVRVTELWLEPLVALLDHSANIAAVQPCILSDRDPSMLEYAGALGGYVDFLGYPFCRGRLFDTLEPYTEKYGTTPMPVFWTSGACMLIRRDLYLEAGGLDETFFAHQEEIDLCWRLQSMGYSLFVVPSGVVYHYGGASLEAGNPRKTFLNYRNNLRLLSKNLPSSIRFLTLFSRFFLDLLAALYFLLKDGRRSAWAVVRAWWAFLTTKTTPIPVCIDRKASYRRLYPHSLLVRYHLHGERLFDQLKDHP